MDYQIILMTIVAFSAVISILGVIFNWLLTPVKEDITELKTDIKTLETGQQNLETGQKALKMDIKTLETGQKELHVKLDQLLNRSQAK